MSVDSETLEKYKERLTLKIDRLKNELKNFDEYKKWTGKTALNLDSNLQLSKLLYSVLKYRIPVGCENSKTGAAALEKINTPFSRALIPYRKNLKLRDTYLAQIERETINGFLFPFFNLHIPRTFRSSSNSPNFQNFPKRDKSATMIRDVLIPRKNYRLIEYDYKGIEVCVSACYHKDKNMIRYIVDPSTDMHRDIAIQLFFKDKETFTKKERYIAKNGFVFPAFYGSIGENMAGNIWDMLEDDTTRSSSEKWNFYFKKVY